MLKVGDIVTPVSGEYICFDYVFKIDSLSFNIEKRTYKYKIKLVYKEMQNIKKSEIGELEIANAEGVLWEEDDFKLIRTIDSIENQANLIEPEYGPMNKRIEMTIIKTVNSYIKHEEESYWKDRNIETINISSIAPTVMPYELNKNKEENNMDKEKEIDRILDIYFDKKEKEIKEEAEKEMNKVLEKDTIQQLIREMNNQLKIIVENAGEDFDNYLEIEYNKTLAVTDKEKFKVKETYYKKQDELKNKHNEVKALIMLADTYEERIKVLKSNGILDNKGNFKN